MLCFMIMPLYKNLTNFEYKYPKPFLFFYNNINIFTLNNLLKLSVLLHGLKLLSDCKNKLAAVKDFYIL